jgi:methionyl aminopeptidase
MTPKEKQNILKAGEIASQAKEFANSIVKPNVSLLEIAEKIEDKIIELSGKPAFPVNLSINEIAAHCTPFYNDTSVAKGLLKVDFGVQIEGFIADTAFSVDLENSEENKKLIDASEKALRNAIQKMKIRVSLGEIGKTIQEAIESEGFSPIINLSGHEMKEYELHAGLTIPNVDNKMPNKIGKGVYAIEPFATNGSGRVIEGKPSGIYLLVNDKNVRSIEARKILGFIVEEYKTLPFCSRWIVKKFGAKSLFALKQLEENGNLHQYPQLVEKSSNASGTKVSQAEHTVLVDDEIIVTTD